MQFPHEGVGTCNYAKWHYLFAVERSSGSGPGGRSQRYPEKINDSGVIVIGHRESSVPFSYYDNQQKVVGYSQAYSNAIADAIKAKLNKPDLQIKMIPITSQNRIPLLQNGTYDYECGSTTNNLERQKQAAFSDTIFVIGTRLLVKKGSPIKDFDVLKGKTVVVTSGTTSEVLLHKLNDEKKMDMRIISAKDHGDSFRTLETGRAVAFMMDDALLAGERALKRKNRMTGSLSVRHSLKKLMAVCCAKTIRSSKAG